MKTSTKGEDLHPALDKGFSLKLESLADDLVLEVCDKDSLSADESAPRPPLGQVRSFVCSPLSATFKHCPKCLAGATWVGAARAETRH